MSRAAGGSSALSIGAVGAVVARHPSLWSTGARQLVRLAPRGWWRRAPFLPRPDEGWLRFRLQTMYGDAEHPLEEEDLLAWLRWCREGLTPAPPRAGKRSAGPDVAGVR